MRFHLAFLGCLVTCMVASQHDTLNQLNSKGKKHGYWLVYLDKYVEPTVKDSAYFYGYDQYDNGTALFTFKKNKWKQRADLNSSPFPQVKGSPVALDGVFKWFDKESKLLYTEETYSAGHPVIMKGYNTHAENKDSIYLSWEYDYTREYENASGTHIYREFDQNGPVELSWFRNGKKGWKYYPCLNVNCDEDEILYVKRWKEGEKTEMITGDLMLEIELMDDTTITDVAQPVLYRGYLVNAEDNRATFSIHSEEVLTRGKNGMITIDTINYLFANSRSNGELRTLEFEKIRSISYLKVRNISNVGGAIAALGFAGALVVAPLVSLDFKSGGFNLDKYLVNLFQYGVVAATGVIIRQSFRKNKFYIISQKKPESDADKFFYITGK